MKRGAGFRYVVGAVVLVMGLAVGLVVGCTSETASAQVVRGWVYADGPVDGAEVGVYYSSSGKLLSTEKSRTYHTGTFDLTVNNLPSEFTVIATNGTVNGQAFTGQIKANAGLPGG